MQATYPQPTTESSSLSRRLGYFLMGPLLGLVLLTLALAIGVAGYQSRHNGRIYTGVSVHGIDLSEMSDAEAAAALSELHAYPAQTAVTFIDPAAGSGWTRTAAELGLAVDMAATVDAAMDVGRIGGPTAQLQELYQSWYYGRSLAPVLVLDESRLNAAIDAIAAEINRPPQNATMQLDGSAAYTPGRNGRSLDTADLHARLLPLLTRFQSAEIELVVTEIPPAIADSAPVASSIQQMVNNPVTFYLEAPLDEADLSSVALPPDELQSWLRVEIAPEASGQLQHNVFVDENALRHWLSQFADELYREPVRARFYFDDNTRELVLVSPHVNGRELDMDATVQQFLAQVNTPNRAIPFVMKEIVPTVNAGATATDLGITELITETTTWFYGSSDARKHNIARSAANFYGIVIAPGEEFSFNKYLGTISEADGYEQGFIILGGQTVEGIGGGVCQVSTTLYQTAFNAGFPITERLPHGYMLGYYNDGEGPGMDATIFSPLVDMKFINNTPHHLLIENYYNEEFEALTFKFYSTSLGRRVEKEMYPWENVTEIPGPEEDRWEYNENLEPGTVEKIDWATEGADVTIRRTVYNADGDVIEERFFVSNYLPVPNVFHYGPDVEPFDYSLVPEDDN